METIDKSKFGTVSVRFWNPYQGCFTGKTYDYAIENELLAILDEGDQLELSDLGKKVNVSSKYWGISQNVSKKFVGNMLSQFDKKRVEQFNTLSKKLNSKKEGNSMEKSMKSMVDKMMDKFVTKVTNMKLSLQDNKMGIVKDGSIFTFDKTTGQIQENMFDLISFEVPSMAFQATLDNVNIGDVIVENGKAIGWVTKVNKTGVTVTRITGTSHTINPPVNSMTGLATVMVVKDIFNMQNAQGMNPMMMMALMSDSESSLGSGDMSSMMQMMMMSSMFGGVNPMGNMMGILGTPGQVDGQVNPMGNMGNMMQTMMMMKMLK